MVNKYQNDVKLLVLVSKWCFKFHFLCQCGLSVGFFAFLFALILTIRCGVSYKMLLILESGLTVAN
jgi:hypothetical protein